MMGWFSTPEPTEPQEPAPVRLASDEFLSGLEMIRSLYANRADQSRASVLKVAQEIASKQYFNFGDIDRAADEVRDSMNRAVQYDQMVSEFDDMLSSYKYRGRRPPYLKDAPPAKND